MALDEVQDLLRDGWIGPHVAVLHFPVPHLVRLGAVGRHNANCDLGRLAQVRAVERDGCDGPATHSLLGLLPQAFEKLIFRWHSARPRANRVSDRSLPHQLAKG